MLSIVAMTEYDPTIWDDFNVPADLDPDVAKDNILIECAELELLYSDPALLKYMIKNWVKAEKPIWEKLADTLDLQYNPIYNLDVTWEETRTPNLTKTRTPNLTEITTPNIRETRTPNLSEARTPNLTETETPTDTNTEAVAGFNSATFENSRKTTRGGNITNTTTGTDTIVTSGTDVNATSGTNTKRETGTDTEHETGTENITTRRYGNQGITMTQDMIQKERDVVQFNLYNYITHSFKNRFCLLVY